MNWYDSLRDAVQNQGVNRCTKAEEEAYKEETGIERMVSNRL